MPKIIQIDGNEYVLSNHLQSTQGERILKHDECFAVLDSQGEAFAKVQGVYYRGQRYLSYWELKACSERLVLLSSKVDPDNLSLDIHLTLPDMTVDGRFIKSGDIHIFRKLRLIDNVLLEEIFLEYYHNEKFAIELSWHIDSDFKDIFAIRNSPNDRHGDLSEASWADGQRQQLYHGRDNIKRYLSVVSSQVPQSSDPEYLVLKIDPHKNHIVRNCYYFDETDAAPNYVFNEQAFEQKLFSSARECQAKHEAFTCLRSSNENLNQWLIRSQADIASLQSKTAAGYYPYAGTPWFSAAFGRDGLFTAMQTLWINPDLTRGVLKYLSHTQAQINEPYREAEPGKILHEARYGEMVNLNELPYKNYYGTIDATPLYLVLAGRYFERTGDLGLISELWESLLQALAWLEKKIAEDKHGFLSYEQHSAQGLLHHGWKDSYDCVYDENGKDALAPIALCEVQAYAYLALTSMARLSEARQLLDTSERLKRSAQKLKRRFNQRFWRPELQSYALALDGNGNPCDIRSSNAGHTLFSGICSDSYVSTLVTTLMDEESFNGWGIRTIASTEPRFNPMSYHNGSVWPHDTAIIAAGLARYGYQDEALAIFEGMFAAAEHFEGSRLPELFCGFDRSFAEQPIKYPYACAPQSWAAGSVFMLVQSFLGLEIDAVKQQVRLSNPRLPQTVNSLTLSDLKVGEKGSISLEFKKRTGCVSVNIIERHGNIKVYISK